MLADAALRGGTRSKQQSKITSTSTSTTPVQGKDKESEKSKHTEKEEKPSNSEWENRKTVPLKGSKKPGPSEKPRKEGLRQKPANTNRFRPDDSSSHTLGIPPSSTAVDRDEVEWGTDIVVAAIPIREGAHETTTTEVPATIPVVTHTTAETEILSTARDVSPLPISPVFPWDEYSEYNIQKKRRK